MLIVETIAKIRIRYHTKKQSIKQISRELKLSRNTVRKALRDNKTAKEYCRDKQPLPKLESYQVQLRGFLSTNNTT